MRMSIRVSQDTLANIETETNAMCVSWKKLLMTQKGEMKLHTED